MRHLLIGRIPIGNGHAGSASSRIMSVLPEDSRLSNERNLHGALGRFEFDILGYAGIEFFLVLVEHGEPLFYHALNLFPSFMCHIIFQNFFFEVQNLPTPLRNPSW